MTHSKDTMPAPATTASQPELAAKTPHHVPLVELTRDGLVESIHYGSLIALTADNSTALEAGEPDAPMYPRSSLKPLQAVALLKVSLDIPQNLLALTAASHSGAQMHRSGAEEILKLHGLNESNLGNSTDLPYGVAEREEWLRASTTAPRRLRRIAPASTLP